MVRTKNPLELLRHPKIMMKLYFHRRFTIRELQELLIDGWTVDGDRQSAYRNNKRVTPVIYREQQESSSKLLKQ